MHMHESHEMFSVIFFYRMRKERKEAERLAAIQAEEDRKRQAELAAEREKKQMEDYKKKMEEMARKKREQDKLRKGMGSSFGNFLVISGGSVAHWLEDRLLVQ